MCLADFGSFEGVPSHRHCASRCQAPECDHQRDRQQGQVHRHGSCCRLASGDQLRPQRVLVGPSLCASSAVHHEHTGRLPWSPPPPWDIPNCTTDRLLGLTPRAVLRQSDTLSAMTKTGTARDPGKATVIEMAQ